MRPAALAFCLTAASAVQGDPLFRLPLDCAFGEDRPCYIQSLVDHDDLLGRSRDYRCGGQSRDGHNGTDFALTSLQDMKRGVDVVAAAKGVVVATRDGMPDRPANPATSDQIEGRECGNAVVLSHGAGWKTQYCHLKRGSVTVARGTSVEAGHKLGEVGLSGKTTFPHLHLTVRHHDRIIDPFAPERTGACPADSAQSLWQETPLYRPTGLISAGFAPALPRYEDIKSGIQKNAPLSTRSPALVLWAYAFGGEPGDRLTFIIKTPDGLLWHRKETALTDPRPLYYRGSGRRRADENQLPAGRYRGTVRLIRDGMIVSDKTITTIIAD